MLHWHCPAENCHAAADLPLLACPASLPLHFLAPVNDRGQETQGPILIPKDISMPTIKTPPLAALFMVCALAFSASAAAHHHHKEDREIAAGIVGLAVAAAIADGGNRHHDVYGPPRIVYEPERPFSPDYGISCYAAQRACYYRDGGFSSHWTHRVYGR